MKWELWQFKDVWEGKEEFLETFQSLDDVRGWIAQRAKTLNAPKIVERELDRDRGWDLIIRLGKIGTFYSLVVSEYYRARPQKPVVIGVPTCEMKLST